MAPGEGMANWTAGDRRVDPWAFNPPPVVGTVQIERSIAYRAYQVLIRKSGI